MKDYPNFEEYGNLDEYEDYEEEENDSLFIATLATISKWFIRIGIVIAIILFIYYIVTGKVTSGLLFLLGLIVAYFFGYGFMFLLDRLVSDNRPASKKNKKGLASVILATNSPNSELVILILIEKCQFVNKKTKKN